MIQDRPNAPGNRNSTGLTITFSICLVAAGLFFVGLQLSHLPVPDTSDLPGDLVDAAVEAGATAPALDPLDPLLQRRTIVVTEGINERTSREVVQKLFHLDAAAPGTDIHLWLASSGGWVDAAFTIVDAMEAIESTVHVTCVGGCYSAGSLVLAGGTGTRTVSRNALVMVHANREDSSEPFSFGRLSLKRFDRFYREHANLPPEWFPLTGDKAYYLSAPEAVESGLADRIAPNRHPRLPGGTAEPGNGDPGQKASLRATTGPE